MPDFHRILRKIQHAAHERDRIETAHAFNLIGSHRYTNRIARFPSSSIAIVEFKYSQRNMDSIGHEKQSPKM